MHTDRTILVFTSQFPHFPELPKCLNFDVSAIDSLSLYVYVATVIHIVTVSIKSTKIRQYQ